MTKNGKLSFHRESYQTAIILEFTFKLLQIFMIVGLPYIVKKVHILVFVSLILSGIDFWVCKNITGRYSVV